MEIILLERVEKLGQMGDVVKVKPGYARNFLLPQGKALRANKNNLERFETEKAQARGGQPVPPQRGGDRSRQDGRPRCQHGSRRVGNGPALRLGHLA